MKTLSCRRNIRHQSFLLGSKLNGSLSMACKRGMLLLLHKVMERIEGTVIATVSGTLDYFNK